MIISKDKVTRAKPVSAQAEAGNIRVLRRPWNDPSDSLQAGIPRDEGFFSELESFPDGKHDDIVDVLSGAFNVLVDNYSMLDAYKRFQP